MRFCGVDSAALQYSKAYHQHTEHKPARVSKSSFERCLPKLVGQLDHVRILPSRSFGFSTACNAAIWQTRPL